MSSLSDTGELELLQLRKWGEFRPKLSDFQQFLISPSREFLLFLSRHSEASLISLKKDRFSEFSPEKLICNVISTTWSHGGDSYDQNDEPAIGDVLIISSGDEVYLHAFRDHSRTGRDPKSSPENVSTNGRWVYWGPTFKDSCPEIPDPGTRQDDRDCWLKSFLVDTSLFPDEDGFVLRFPSFPSADILSFSIFEGILNLLNQSKSHIGDSPKLPGKDMYQCSRVFSGTHDHCVGLALTHSVDEENADSSMITVIIVTISVKGLKWVCFANLPESPSGWVDFQMFGGLLACLNGSGMISIFDAKSGNALLCVSALNNRVMHFKDNSKVDEITSPKKGNFTGLLFASQSPSLHAVDENGVVYSVDIMEILKKEMHERYRNYQGIMLPSLKNTSAEINRHKEFTDFSRSSERKSDSEGKKERKLTLISMKEKADSYPSGFSVQMKDKCARKGFPLKSAATRRIFLPLDKYGTNSTISSSPLGITRLVRTNGEQARVLHIGLRSPTQAYDDSSIYSWKSTYIREKSLGSDAIGCCLEGFLYVVTDEGFYVVLPSLPVSPGATLFMSFDRSQPKEAFYAGGTCRSFFRTWQIEILDGAILYEGPDEADRFCLKSGWDSKIARMRRLELGLYYLRFDDIERSLEKLADVMLAEEGMLRLLLSSAFKVFCKVSTESEVALVSRLLTLSARFATKLIQRYGLIELEKYDVLDAHETNHALEAIIPRRLEEMAHYLEVIRNLHKRLHLKSRKTTVDGGDASNPVQPGTVNGEAFLDSASLAIVHSPEDAVSTLESTINGGDQLSLRVDPSVDALQPIRLIPQENSMDMITRWETDGLDLKTIVEDALNSDRIPLAVLKLHRQHQREISKEEVTPDSFEEVCRVGRAIAYGLFLKGESELAIRTLEKLGDDIEISLCQLLFGTLRRSIRSQVFEGLKRLEFLKLHEINKLERLSLIERLYPNSSFWGTYSERQRQSNEVPFISSPPEEHRIQLNLNKWIDCTIECDEIDGVVIGSWRNISKGYDFPLAGEGVSGSGYWVCAAIWSDSWDQTTMDRIALDEQLSTGIEISWESMFQYYVAHNDWNQIKKLLDTIPSDLLMDGDLRINRSCSHPDQSSNIGDPTGISNLGHPTGISSSEELGHGYMIIHNVKILKLSVSVTCSSLMEILLQQELANRLIFLKEYWESVEQIMHILARTNLVNKKVMKMPVEKSDLTLSDSEIRETDVYLNKDTFEAFHQLVVLYCAQHGLPHLLDLYLHHHELVQDDHPLFPTEFLGRCHWAKWLLFSKAKNHVFDASFANAYAILSNNKIHHDNLTMLDVESICTIDDLAKEGELIALATLAYAPVPIQKCLLENNINKSSESLFHCTLKNLQPGLQNFPTLWSTLKSASSGYDSVRQWSHLPEYLNWRDNMFSSSEGDTSLVKMLPYWFPNAVRRLVRLFAQGPLGYHPLEHSLSGEALPLSSYSMETKNNASFNCLSWEASIEKCIKEELFPSLEESKFSVEHHLNRGHAFGVFNHLLASRSQKLKSARANQPTSGTNVQADVQTLLEPLAEDEQSIFSSVMPLAIVNFENHGFVAACAFLLELLGLSTSMLHVDVLVLRRISSYHKRNLTDSRTAPLARALSENYKKLVQASGSGHNNSNKVCPQSQSIVNSVLHDLEKASLPSPDNGKSCGLWLKNGHGDGTEFRSRQKADSKHWSLVTEFCQMHDLPLSTKYLVFLAKDNDWVGFLTEAQQAGFPIDTVIHAVSEFGDPRLRLHILTVLRSMESVKKRTDAPTSSSSTMLDKEMSLEERKNVTNVELFSLVADCEKQKNPGEVLLQRAKDLQWSLLAMIASCFPDVSSLSCMTVWLEITAARETSCIKVDDTSYQNFNGITAAVKSTNDLLIGERSVPFHYDRKSPKRRRHSTVWEQNSEIPPLDMPAVYESNPNDEQTRISHDPEEALLSLSDMVAVLCEQKLYLPLLRAFDMFLPSCLLLPFVRFLQAFSQMRLSEASAHLASFSARMKEEPHYFNSNIGNDESVSASWVSKTAVKAANSVLSTCPSSYEKICLLRLLEAAEFGDGGNASACFQREYWKFSVAAPLLSKGNAVYVQIENFDDVSIMMELVKRGKWEEARHCAKLMELSDEAGRSSVHHVTEMQAEAMVAEYKEFLWDIEEERSALWGHCQRLFVQNSFPPLQAGRFFLRYAQTLENEITARELHEITLLALQWLSGSMTQSNPVYPLHLLREMETRIWLLSLKSEPNSSPYMPTSLQNSSGGNTTNVIEHTATVITMMDNHISHFQTRTKDKSTQPRHLNSSDASSSASGNTLWTKRRGKILQKDTETVESSSTGKNKNQHVENVKIDGQGFSGWEEQLRPVEFEKAVLSLLEYGQVAAARQLQQKLSPSSTPSELRIIEAALRLAYMMSPTTFTEFSLSALDPDLASVIESSGVHNGSTCDILQVLEELTKKCSEGGGRGFCKKIVAVVRACKVLGLPFSEAFEKRPIELLQLLALKAQESFEEAQLLVQTHPMPPASIAKILAESFLKGLLAAHRGGYMDSQNDEGPAPLLWRISDFLKWAKLCPFEQEVGHALTHLVMTGQEIPNACEVELLILAHHFYKRSGCLDGVDVLVALAAKRVESYVSEGDFLCLARLMTGISNFHALNFILGILIENDQLVLLLQKFSAGDTTEASTGFRMAILTALEHFRPDDLDASVMVHTQFDMKHETGALQERRAEYCLKQWLGQPDRTRHSTLLLEAMRLLTCAAEVYVTIDAGQKTHRTCARASLLSLQLRIPDSIWTDLSETNARRAMAEQPRFQEALLVAEAYSLNHPGEWAPALWARMLRPDLIEQFVTEFSATLPLQPAMLLELARYYRAEVIARGEQSHFSVWLSPGGLPAEWMRHLGKSMRCLLRKTRDLRLRAQLASLATGFNDIVDACNVVLDKVPELSGPLILKKGHGGAYLPLV